MASNDVVRARIDKKIKDEAGNVLSEMGLSVTSRPITRFSKKQLRF